MTLYQIIIPGIYHALFAIASIDYSYFKLYSDITLYKTEQLNTILSELILVLNISRSLLRTFTFPAISVVHIISYLQKGYEFDKVANFMTMFIVYFSSFIFHSLHSIDTYK